MSKISVILAIALAGGAAFVAWQRAGQAPVGNNGLPELADTDSPEDARAPLDESEVSIPLESAGQGAPGSMQTNLLNTTEGNRNQILGLTIADADYSCPTIRSAKTVGHEGLVWRVHCGDTLVYWVEVNEFDRLSVTPIPYGNFGPEGGSSERRTPVVPSNGDERSLDLIQPVEPR